MSLKNIVLILGIGMVCIGTSLLFINRQKSSELSDAEIKKRAEMLGMVEPNKDAILTSELESLKDNTENEEDIENVENIEKKETKEEQGKDLQDKENQKTENNQEIENQGIENQEIENQGVENQEIDSQKNKDKDKEKEVEKNSNKNTLKKEKTKKTNKSKKNKKNVKKENTKKKNTKQKETENKDTVIVKISSGMTAGEICRKLQEEGLIEDAEDFRQYLVDKNIQRKLQAGTFEIVNGADYEEIVGSIYRG